MLLESYNRWQRSKMLRMSVQWKWILCGVFFLLFHRHSSGQAFVLKDWSFREVATGTWRKAQVPGCTYTDLMYHRQIPDPYVGSMENEVQWVAEKTWEYRCAFASNRRQREATQAELMFKGLDTYADVYLNDSLVLSADNMFRTWTVKVSGLLKKKNHLRVVFHPVSARAAQEASALRYTLPEGLRCFTRKAQYHYGWDWAPRLLSAGIWQPVLLNFPQEISLQAFSIDPQPYDGRALVARASVQVRSSRDTAVKLLVESEALEAAFSLDLKVKAGVQTVQLLLPLKNIRYWNPNGKGKPHVYPFTCRLAGSTSSVTCTTGFRSLELVQEKDAYGKSFGFRVNRQDIFARGANLVPPDMFMSRVHDSVYHGLVLKAKEAGMNMLRVWGGGVYLPDIFYDYCDRYGILVWQDFMFACSMVPGGDAFRENVRMEAAEQVQRLRHHPCIALWCGNNESDEGWHNWGWQKQWNYTPADSAKIWNDYLTLFEQALPAIVDSLDPQRAYWPSSPSKGWGRKESLTEGDCHYWGVWWGMERFSMYKAKTGRFMSEYGFQGLPDLSVWKGYVDTLDLSSASFLHHQKHPRGSETINHALQHYFGVPRDIRTYTYFSQLQQAYGMKEAILAHRGRSPYCRGSLFWQWNDCWPSISWSALDVHQRPKLFYHQAKHSMDTLLLFTTEDEKGLTTVAHNDGVEDVSITVRLYCVRTDTVVEPFGIDEQRVRLKPGQVLRDIIRFPTHQMTRMDTSNLVFVTEAIDNFTFSTLFRDHYHRCLPRHLQLQKAGVKVQRIDDQSLLLIADVFTYGVYLYADDGQVQFSDNGFHLLPGERKMVAYKGDFSAIRWTCYNNTRP